MTHKPIPIAAAKRIAQEYGWDQVVIYGRSIQTGAEHMTTYGRTKAMCAAAGKIGRWLQEKMGWYQNNHPDAMTPERLADYTRRPADGSLSEEEGRLYR